MGEKHLQCASVQDCPSSEGGGLLLREGWEQEGFTDGSASPGATAKRKFLLVDWIQGMAQHHAFV